VFPAAAASQLFHRRQHVPVHIQGTKAKQRDTGTAAVGKRGGKNVLITMAYCTILEKHPSRIHLIAGVSTATACKVLRELLIALDKGWPGFQA